MGVYADEDFWSFQICELANNTPESIKKKYNFWWWAIKKGLKGIESDKLDTYLDMAVAYESNKKTREELAAIVQAFLNEPDELGT